MIPTNNGSSAPCDPISSNCVIWQGPDIPCINLCNGDTVSEVIAKLAQELCDIIEATCDCNPDLRELSLQCIPAPAQENPDLAQYLNAIIDYICKIPTGADTIVVELPDCLHYDNAQGNPVTALPIDEYALYLANTICDILDAIAIINNQITDIINRLVILEGCVLPCDPSGGGDPQVISSCLLPANNGGQGGAQVPASTLLLALETAFCTFSNAVGSVEGIASAINVGSCITGTTTTLSDPTVSYGSINSWINNVQDLAGSNSNQWNIICDLYAAVSDIQQNCCDDGCDGVSITFSQQVNTSDATGLATDIVFNFTSSTIPAGFTDCGSSIKITDSQGSAIAFPFDVVGAQTNPTAVTVPIGAQGLLLTGTLTAVVATCVSDGTSTCQEQQTISIPLTIPCPTGFSAKQGNQSGTDIIFFWTNALGTTVTYDWETIQVSTGQVIASGTISNPGQSLSASVNGLLPGENYTFQVTITDPSGASVVCPLGSYSVPGVNCTSRLVSTKIDGGPAPEDIYLGWRAIEGQRKPYYYSVANDKIIEGQNYDPNTICKNPKIGFSTLPGAGSGTIDLDVDTYMGSFDSITIEYSSDGINWTPYSANPVTATATITLNTGITTGSIYVRGQQTCNTNPLTTSTYTILRYDHNTSDITVYANAEDCPEPFINDIACPTGVWVINDGVLPCDGVDYPVPSGIPNRSRWYYVGKHLDSDGSTKYVYGGWTHQGQLTGVVLCCECPAFVMPWKIGKLATVPIGGSITVTVPYLIGDGTPQMNVITPPVSGNLSQNAQLNNQFTYTHNGGVTLPGDTFTVEITTTTQGECNSAQGTIQLQINTVIQVGGGVAPAPKRGDVSLFVNTTGFNTADAPAIQNIAGAIRNKIVDECPQWNNGVNKLFIIPVNDNNILGYPKSLVDAGASVSLDPGAAWTAIADLPPDWTGGTYDNRGMAHIIVLSNSSAPQYHDNALIAGWGVFPGQQPKVPYLSNYDEWVDILEGTEVSAWAKNQKFDGTAPFEFGIDMTIIPLTMDDTGTTAANILMQIGAYVGTQLFPSQYGIKTAVDVSSYMMRGLVPGSVNPYEGAVTPNGTLIEGLYRKKVMVHLDQPANGLNMTELLASINAGTDEGRFVDKVVRSFKGGSDDCPQIDPAASHVKLYELRPDCSTNEEVAIIIANDVKNPLIIGDIVSTQKADGKDACWEVVAYEEDGVAQIYTKFDTCELCLKALNPPAEA